MHLIYTIMIAETEKINYFDEDFQISVLRYKYEFKDEISILIEEDPLFSPEK